MKTLVKTQNTYQTPIQIYYCDTEEDFNNLSSKNLPNGSEAYILDKNIIKIKLGENWYDKSSGGSSPTPPQPIEDLDWAHDKEGF